MLLGAIRILGAGRQRRSGSPSTSWWCRHRTASWSAETSEGGGRPCGGKEGASKRGIDTPIPLAHPGRRAASLGSGGPGSASLMTQGGAPSALTRPHQWNARSSLQHSKVTPDRCLPVLPSAVPSSRRRNDRHQDLADRTPMRDQVATASDGQQQPAPTSTTNATTATSVMRAADLI